jgi:hypothetical protein
MTETDNSRWAHFDDVISLSGASLSSMFYTRSCSDRAKIILIYLLLSSSKPFILEIDPYDHCVVNVVAIRPM